MKNGLMIYPSYNGIFNIGDYIQSLAALQFINGDVEYINRERLDKYTDESIKLIMNGWFLHEPKHWPPSEFIKPLLVSFHLNSDAYQLLGNKNSIDFFKKHEPIGCRDKSTMHLFLEKGISAYFSGCLTLTLGEKYSNNEKSEEIYFVDPYYQINKDFLSIAKHAFILLLNFTKIKRICKLMHNSLSVRLLIKTTFFYKDYKKIFDSKVLENSIYIKHEIKDDDFMNENEKFNFARTLLYKYSKAKFIVTSRIHCALPCLGLETPVLYIENIHQGETSYCRLDGLRELLHVIKYDNGKMNIPFINPGLKKIKIETSFKNKNNYKSLKEQLIAQCNNFLNL